VTCLTYEQFKLDDRVFEHGTVGDKFYIILEGEVAVMVPNLEINKVKKRIDGVNSQIE
jgi:CRP-like cAMP-binding protein